MLKKIKEELTREFRKSYDDTRNKIDNFINDKDNIELSYLKSNQQSTHNNIRKRLKDYLLEDEVVLQETLKISSTVLESYFITSYRIISIRALDMFGTASKVKCNTYYYSDISNTRHLEVNRKYNEILVSFKGNQMPLNMNISPKISHEIHKIINRKI